MIRLDRQPTATDLKLFGLSLSLMLSAIGGLVWARTSQPAIAQGLWIAAALICVTYYVSPATQRPLYRAWLVAMFPLAWIISTLVLGLLYFGLITPIGLLSRLAGRDPLQLRQPKDSYWIPRPPQPAPKSRYFRQH